ncbi:hypothetical protein ASPZODRAFT_135124 [Penicilliopsis zonata CBS 506.65]|uniref:Uncharacterized protein n=1 Tax=Penicilliopsis zonata CBS 506.65 TaxID=1073090 RepID=A0A1L9SAX4_9EURO|nr:hypothetical protein ASPZODRAFT_135124 [Penicilliopsis zonata CBS 506.65]OJJ44314.1 hypothetical protein ASPZODRAFT_135124 [Penicilliopsis zonata CBS 506.65]
MQYINRIASKRRSSHANVPTPVLTAEDEAFLQQLTSQSQPGATAEPATQDPEVTTPRVGKDAQIALMDGAQDIPLPASPAEELGKELGEEGRQESQRRDSGHAVVRKESTGKRRPFGWMRMKSGGKPATEPTVVEPVSTAEEDEARREAEDMTDILERLNLASVNNRVFSISDETQELLRKFKLIFKDMVNGVPTAYHDLEMLLSNGNRQLQQTYTQLPTFLQKLIEKLPEKWTETLAPEMLAVASERAARSGINLENVGKAAAAANKMGIQVPTLEEVVAKPAAITGMLRSIVAFLRARFPAVMGMNVLWSLALFILLFVLWYCHKRGREVRLENERLVTQDEMTKLNEEAAISGNQIRETETLTTTAPPGASADEIRDGVQEVQAARQAAAAAGPAAARKTDNEQTASAADGSPLSPRSRTRFSIWGKPATTKPVEPTIAPYPGT